MNYTTQSEPVYLISVNNSPERAGRIIAKLIEAVADRYNIIHAGNSATIEGVADILRETKPTPQLLFCASMWTVEEQESIQKTAKETIEGIKTFAIPTGMQVAEGPEVVLKFLIASIDSFGIPRRA